MVTPVSNNKNLSWSERLKPNYQNPSETTFSLSSNFGNGLQSQNQNLSNFSFAEDLKLPTFKQTEPSFFDTISSKNLSFGTTPSSFTFPDFQSNASKSPIFNTTIPLPNLSDANFSSLSSNLFSNLSFPKLDGAFNNFDISKLNLSLGTNSIIPSETLPTTGFKEIKPANTPFSPQSEDGIDNAKGDIIRNALARNASNVNNVGTTSTIDQAKGDIIRNAIDRNEVNVSANSDKPIKNPISDQQLFASGSLSGLIQSPNETLIANNYNLNSAVFMYGVPLKIPGVPDQVGVYFKQSQSWDPPALYVSFHVQGYTRVAQKGVIRNILKSMLDTRKSVPELQLNLIIDKALDALDKITQKRFTADGRGYAPVLVIQMAGSEWTKQVGSLIRATGLIGIGAGNTSTPIVQPQLVTDQIQNADIFQKVDPTQIEIGAGIVINLTSNRDTVTNKSLQTPTLQITNNVRWNVGNGSPVISMAGRLSNVLVPIPGLSGAKVPLTLGVNLNMRVEARQGKDTITTPSGKVYELPPEISQVTNTITDIAGLRFDDKSQPLGKKATANWSEFIGDYLTGGRLGSKDTSDDAKWNAIKQTYQAIFSQNQNAIVDNPLDKTNGVTYQDYTRFLSLSKQGAEGALSSNQIEKFLDLQRKIEAPFVSDPPKVFNNQLTLNSSQSKQYQVNIQTVVSPTGQKEFNLQYKINDNEIFHPIEASTLKEASDKVKTVFEAGNLPGLIPPNIIRRAEETTPLIS